MPRKKSSPTRDKRLTALLSEKEMRRATRMVKKIDDVANLSELVRLCLEEKASTVLARKPKTSTAATGEVKPKRGPGRPRKNPVEVVEAPKKRRGRPPKAANGVTASAPAAA